MNLMKFFLPWKYIKQLEHDLEYERVRLAGCGVAAMMNTADSVKERITKDSPYWSASYGDVCRAVDAEIQYRTSLDLATIELLRYEREVTEMITSLGLNIADFKTNGGTLELEKLKDAVLTIVPVR